MHGSPALFAACLLAGFFASGAAHPASVFFGEDTDAFGAFVPGGGSEAARDAFLARTVATGAEDFEGFANDTPVDGRTLAFPGTGVTAMAATPDLGRIRNLSQGGRFATSGSFFLNFIATGFTLDFSEPVGAVGTYMTDVGDFGTAIPDVEIVFETGDRRVEALPVTPDRVSNLLFWGIVTLPGEPGITRLRFFGGDGVEDEFGFDDITVARADQVRVPLPATLVPLLAGLGLLGAAATRKV